MEIMSWVSAHAGQNRDVCLSAHWHLPSWDTKKVFILRKKYNYEGTGVQNPHGTMARDMYIPNPDPQKRIRPTDEVMMMKVMVKVMMKVMMIVIVVNTASICLARMKGYIGT